MKKRIFCISILILFIAVLFVIAIGLMKKEIIVEKNVAKVNKLEADTTTIVPYEENGIKYVTYEQFGDVTGDGNARMDDILKINSYRLGKLETL